MAHKFSRKWKRAGFTLITALAFTLIVGTILAGVGTLSMSHLGRAKVEGDYANAVALADAGVNYEIGWVSRNTSLAQNCTGSRVPGCIDQLSSPYTGSINPLPGTYTVGVSAWNTVTNSCTNGAWSAPNDMCVTSIGNVNGIQRKIVVRGTRKSVFDQYAIYAYSISVFNGVGSSGKDGVDGNMGTNGPVTFNGALGSGAVLGTLSLNGSGASSNSMGSNVQSNTDAVTFPTVSQVANTMFPGGLTWLQTHNSNAGIMMLKTADPTLASEPTLAGLTLADVNSKMTTVGFTAATRSLSTAAKLTTDTSSLDAATSGSRFEMPADPVHNATAIGVKGEPVYFFPPGDYYLSDLSVINKAGIVFLTHLGNIRIWVDSAAGGSDNISKVDMVFTDPSAAKFRLYYNKCGTLTMHGQAVFRGSIYAIKSGCGNSDPGIDLSGGNEIYGSVIANSFVVGGGSFVVYPNNGGNDQGGDFALWYGFKDNWKEMSWNGTNSVFSDGTQN